MATKFIKLTTGFHDEVYLNPIFIISIRKVGQTDKIIITTMDGNDIKPNESFSEVMKKIKDTDSLHFAIK